MPALWFATIRSSMLRVMSRASPAYLYLPALSTATRVAPGLGASDTASKMRRLLIVRRPRCFRCYTYLFSLCALTRLKLRIRHLPLTRCEAKRGPDGDACTFQLVSLAQNVAGRPFTQRRAGA